MSDINEVQFTANVKSWIDAICRQFAAADPSFPFLGAEVEERKAIGTKRRDLTLRPRDNPKGHALTGEVKLPYNPDGRSPYSEAFVLDAHQKANSVGAQYFFTWNVNRFVLWQTFKAETPIIQRSVTFYDWLPEGQQITRPEDFSREDVEPRLKRRLEEFLLEYAEIFKGAKPFPRRPLDEWFIHLLECALDRPTVCTLAEILRRYNSDGTFHRSLDEWMIRNLGATISEGETQDNLQRAAKYSCYVLTNRVVFYDALRRKYPNRLRALLIPDRAKTGEAVRQRLEAAFKEAEQVTEDYETVFRGEAFGDGLPFLSNDAIGGWRGLVEQVEKYDFTALDYDIIGQIFDGLISPRERHRYGQHYTKSEIVDLINAFAIRSCRDRVLDPACGGGTFLMRAYGRKKWLAERAEKPLSHESLLSDIYGVDISAYAVHLSTISLATRDLIRASNYPRVACGDFFDVSHGKKVFPAGISETDDQFDLVGLPDLDGIVGNPPYIRQERLSADQKRTYRQKCETHWKAIRLSGRSDIHVYFWPYAASYLKEGGYFGFLTSSSWLDVEYGFHLQKWILENFAIVAVMESSVEPWFTDARVATTVTILRREPNVQKRLSSLVRFIQIRRPVADILFEYQPAGDRFEAAERVRDFLENVSQDVENENWRIRIVRQEELISTLDLSGDDDEESGEEEDIETKNAHYEMKNGGDPAQRHTGAKWGIHLRAPDVFFEIADRCGGRMVPLGQIAAVRFGTKSGCDAFFYPRDITDNRLREFGEKRFREVYGLTRKQAERIRVCTAGDDSVHLIEAEFLEPEIHSLMEINSISIDLKRLGRKVLIVRGKRSALRGSHVLDYIKWGEAQGFHQRETCAARETKGKAWYNIEPDCRSIAILPKIQQYRHIIPINSKGLIVNSSLLEICASACDPEVLVAILNSTLIGLIKWNYGRGLGREANLQLDVYSAKMMLVPNPVGAEKGLQSQIKQAFRALAKRPRRNLAEELCYEERGTLDGLILQLLGVSGANERNRILTELYEELTALHRSLRDLELKAQANRLKAARRGRTTPMSIAAEIWELLEHETAERLRVFPGDFVSASGSSGTQVFELPEGRARLEQMFGDFSVNIGRRSFNVGNEARAQLLMALVNEGICGPVALPESPAACRRALKDWQAFRDEIHNQFQDLAAQRTADPDLFAKIVADLWRRYWRWAQKH